MSENTLVKAVLAHAQETPDKLAVVFKSEQLTYAQIARVMKALAGRLSKEYGIGPHSFVAVSAVSKPDYVAALLAAQYLGASVVPLDKTAKPAALANIYAAARPTLILTDGGYAGDIPSASLRELYADAQLGNRTGCPDYTQPAPQDTAEILFTTGTTGKPKGAVLTYDSVWASMQNTWVGIGMQKDDRVLLPLPLNHSFGMRVLRSALWGGAAVVLQNGFTFAKELETNIDRYGCTALACVSASIETIRRQMGDRFAGIIGKLRYIEISAGALPVDMRKKLLAELPHTQLHNTWGSTESGGALFLNLSERPDKMTSAGKPLPGIEMKVVDANGDAIEAHSADTAGRMALKGRMQMSGYIGMPEQTAQTLVDGWLLTNDLVYTDEEGYVYMLGRADDIINVGGEKVSPIEVEQAAQEYEGVYECACVGVDDPDGVTGKTPVLYVVPETGFDAGELIRFLGERLERFKLPRRVIPVHALPRNRMQKLDRKALERMWRASGDKPLTNDVIRAIYTRRSVRDFKEQPVPRALLEQIVACGCQAPSGHNLQSWRFTVICDHAEIVRLRERISAIASRCKVYFYGFNNPDTLILISNDRRNPDGIQDCSCAAQNIMLAAHAMGLGSVWINALMKLCDEPEIRPVLDAYGIPKTHNVWAMIALGYPANCPRPLAKRTDVVRWIEDKDTADEKTMEPSKTVGGGITSDRCDPNMA